VEPLWLSGKVVKNEKINEIQRTRVRSPPRATSLKKIVELLNKSTAPRLDFLLQRFCTRTMFACFSNEI
jgi:hypothetical protein